MFLHYLGKFNNSNLLQISKKMQTKNLIFCTHLVLVHMTYILIICFNFSFLLNIFLQIADDWRRQRKRSLVNVSCALDPRSVSPLWCLSAHSRPSNLEGRGTSQLGCTDLVFVDPGVKINGTYYRDVLLTKQLLPVMCEVSGEFFVFQHDNAPAHRHVTPCDFFFAVAESLASKQPWP